ncbi:hypothetical protein HGB24_02515, partial [Candidatus Saccharibacteria bacterium]|nr:hypothetical protein [Candidatus Saccharibacteria bacterium]
MRLSSSYKLKKGFTLVEVLIISPIIILMIGIFVSAIVSMTGDVLSSRGSDTISYNIQDALNRIQADIKISGGFLATNNIALASPQGSDDAKTNFKNNSTNGFPALILNMYATTNNPYSNASTPAKMYMSNQPNACSSAQLSQNVPFTYNVVYFVRNNSLWRRVLMPSYYTSAGCSGGVIASPWQIPSCNPSLIASNSFCKTKDEELVQNVQASGISINYYSTPSGNTANTIAGDAAQTSDDTRQSALASASTVEISITGASQVAGRTVSQTAKMRATSPNDYFDGPTDVYWSNAQFQGSWTNYADTFHTGGYRKTKDGIVVLKGLLRGGSSGQVIFYLPDGYKPAKQLIFQVATDNGSWGAGGRIDITTDGRVIATTVNSSWVSLDNIRFLAASNAPDPFVNLPYYNNWASYNSLHPSDTTDYGDAAYAIDADGRVNIRGLVSSNSSTQNDQNIASVPTNIAPSEYHDIAEYNCAGFGETAISIDGMIKSKVSSSSTTCLSLVMMYYPSSYSGWKNMILQNGWLAYQSGTATPQYTKSSDGIVTLHGLIKSGSTSQCNIIATLPVGYRPSSRLLFGTVANLAFSRIDLDSAGNIWYCSGSNVWLSLNNLSFYAEQ